MTPWRARNSRSCSLISRGRQSTCGLAPGGSRPDRAVLGETGDFPSFKRVGVEDARTSAMLSMDRPRRRNHRSDHQLRNRRKGLTVRDQGDQVISMPPILLSVPGRPFAASMVSASFGAGTMWPSTYRPGKRQKKTASSRRKGQGLLLRRCLPRQALVLAWT